jgi:hypothetical protein
MNYLKTNTLGIFQLNMARIWKQCSYAGHIPVEYGNSVHMRGIFQLNMAHVWKQCSYVGHIPVKYAPRIKTMFIRGAYSSWIWPAYGNCVHTRGILQWNMDSVWTLFPYMDIFYWNMPSIWKQCSYAVHISVECCLMMRLLILWLCAGALQCFPTLLGHSSGTFACTQAVSAFQEIYNVSVSISSLTTVSKLSHQYKPCHYVTFQWRIFSPLPVSVLVFSKLRTALFVFLSVLHMSAPLADLEACSIV